MIVWFHSISQRLLPLNVPNVRDKKKHKTDSICCVEGSGLGFKYFESGGKKMLQSICSFVGKVLNTTQHKHVVSDEFLENSNVHCKFIRKVICNLVQLSAHTGRPFILQKWLYYFPYLIGALILAQGHIMNTDTAVKSSVNKYQPSWWTLGRKSVLIFKNRSRFLTAGIFSWLWCLAVMPRCSSKSLCLRYIVLQTFGISRLQFLEV